MKDHNERGSESLEGRLRRQLLVLLLLVMSAVVALVHLGVNRLTHEFVLSRLQHDGESLIAALQQTASGDWQLSADRLPEVYQRVHSGHYYLIQSEGLNFRSRSLWDVQPDVQPLPVGATAEDNQNALPGQNWLGWQQGFQKADRPFSLWIAEDVAPLQAKQLGFELMLVMLVAITVPLLLFVQRRILKRGFARLNPLQNALEARHLGSEIAFPRQVPREVLPLVEAIEQLLKRSDAQISRSRTALGNLAHELKRPLQQLQWYAEQYPQAEELQQLYQRLRELIDRELRRARIAGSSSSGHLFIPTKEIPVLAEVLKKMGRGELDFVSDLPDGPMPFDRDDMLELLGNLLDNAWRYASSQVRLSMYPATEAQGWNLCVEDDGKGVSDEDLARMTERGIRLDEQPGVQSSEGHGLGLSICNAVVESYNGQLSYGHSALGGLRVDIFLPV